MNSHDVRSKYISFFLARGHKEIPSAKLVPENDPTTLFTSSGMQPLIPYLLGVPHPLGKRLINSQKSFRAQDIDEVGDNRHTTFFEMLGNWSLGDYFKKEQLPWIWEFLTKELVLPKEKLFVSVFEGLPAQAGTSDVPRDEESAGIWKSLGVPEDHIFYYGVKKNWWSRSGEPENMPPGEPGGPDSEVFFDFGTPHDPKFGDVCNPNCDCGRFMEIANSVFMQYQKKEDGSLVELAQKNVDFGGGLERMVAAANNDPDVFKTDLFWPIIERVQKELQVDYVSDPKSMARLRVIADHIKAAVFLVSDGVVPSNKLQGYVLRRLLRRASVKLELIKKGSMDVLSELVESVVEIYQDTNYFASPIETKIIDSEINQFKRSLDNGFRIIEKIENISGNIAFDLYQTYGFPLEITTELFEEKGQQINREEFNSDFKKHQELSRTAAKGMFKGGLADHSEQTTKLHTAHHLLLAALQKIVDPEIKQRGSNITSQRLRIDVNFSRKITPEEIQKIEALVNEKIKENMAVTRVEMEREKAEKIGAQREFGQKYPDRVSVYFVGSPDNFFSAEFCGGPHVTKTGELGTFKILKEESSGAGIRRIYGILC